MHLYRSALRRTTWLMLVVWLFALGAGVANACLLSVPNESSDSPVAAQQQDTSAAHAHHYELPDPGVAGCLKFCDEPTLTIAKIDQSIADGGPGTVGVWYRAWTAAVASDTAVQLSGNARRPAHLALPIAARPHRLTL